jgi:hypothetical protein
MPNLTIPERFRPGLFRLVRLSDSELGQLITALEKAPTSAKVADIEASIAGHVHGVDPDGLREIVSTLFSLYVVRAQADLKVKRFAADVINALRDIGQDQPVNSAAEEAKARATLEKVLQIDPLNRISKAIGLQAEHALTFCDAKVLTDLRPVFPSDPSERPVGAVVTHTLKLEYHDGGDHKQLFVALDSDDIETLAEALKRASTKAATLKKFFADIGIPDLTIS